MSTTIADDVPLQKAVTFNLNEILRDTTLKLIADQMASGAPRLINFRGDIAENFQYDKIKPLTDGRAFGHVVVIKGQSQKTGKEAYYQILSNQWKLLEVVALLD